MSSAKKRVRFADSPPDIREFEEPPGPTSKQRKTDPMEALEGEISGVCLGGGGGDGLSGAQASSIRAASRRSQLLAAFGPEQGGMGVEEGAEEGEEDYDDPEEMYDSVTGVPFEPFHLKREREEGYFDEDGCYVEYKRDEVQDSWADGLANIVVDEGWLARVLSGRGRQEAAGAAAAAAGEAPEMPAEEIAEHKKRLLELLLPGENVLQALRRLAAVRQPLGGSGGDGRGSPASDPLTRHPLGLRTQAMPSVVTEMFEQLTELSSLLMDQGVHLVHSMSREALECSLNSAGAAAPAAVPVAAADAGLRLAERLLAAAAPAGGGGDNGSAAAAGRDEDAAPAPQQPAADADADIFGDDEPAGAAAAASQGGSQQAAAQASQVAGGGGSGTSGPPPPAQQQAEAQQQQAEALLRGPSGDVAMSEPAAAQQQGGAPPFAPAPADSPDSLDGFTRDGTTGLLYNSDLGCYYDPQRRLFGDSASGQWYAYSAATGEYTPAG